MARSSRNGFLLVLSLLAILTAGLAAAARQAPATAGAQPWLDTALSPDARAAALVGAMTLDEKISQLMNTAPAIERLGVPALRLVERVPARRGPRRRGDGRSRRPSAWRRPSTRPLMREVATAISDEARAKHHEFLRRGERARYQGLTFWSPNINIFRDPRWGRGQETYGEDPFLTARMGVEFVKGLQGDDPKYLKVIATREALRRAQRAGGGPPPLRRAADPSGTCTRPTCRPSRRS